MDWNDIQRMKAISRRKHKADEEAREGFVGSLQKHLSKKGYRADLVLVANVKSTHGTFPVEVRYNVRLGHPSDKDLMVLIAKHYEKKAIDWETVVVDTNSGIITLNLEPATEVIPIKSLQEIPPEFTAIGTGIYKRAADATGDVHEIWELIKTDAGHSLVRKKDDMEITADDETKFTKGDVADTPYGPGVIQRFDEHGNAVVLVGSKKKLVAQKDLIPYSTDKEKQKLIDYYTQVYGDPEFARGLVEKYDTR
jgi:hypothetical protein